MYATSKHAVKDFTDTLRMELEADGAPVVVTLIKPSSIDTPYPQRAKNYMKEEPTLPPPVYTPQVVAEAILHCTVTSQRDLTVGSGGKLISLVGQHAPRLTDKAMKTNLFLGLQKTNQPARNREGALHTPTSDLNERGQYEGYVKKSSFYTWASRRPLSTAATFAATGLALAALLRGNRVLNGNRK